MLTKSIIGYHGLYLFLLLGIDGRQIFIPIKVFGQLHNVAWLPSQLLGFLRTFLGANLV